MATSHRSTHRSVIVFALLAGSLAGLGGCAANRAASATPAQPPVVEEQPSANNPQPSENIAYSGTGIFERTGSNRDPNESVSLYNDIFDNALSVEFTAPGSRSGGVNQAQVSFALEGSDFDPDVSRDGQWLVFASTQHRPTADIYIKSVGKRVVTQLTSDAAQDVMPRISPDGSRIAFASDRNGNWDLFVMPTTGGKAIQITAQTSDELHPSWSPDGKSIVFCRKGDVSNRWEVWVADVGNTAVSSFIGYGLFPSWCPVAGTGADGSDKILFQKGRERGERTYGIWTVDYADGKAENLTEILASPVAACINPTWSPDGQWVAFATVPNPGLWSQASGARPPMADLWMVDLNGESKVNLTAGKFCNLMPAWSAGNKLYFVSDRAGTENIWSLDAGGALALARAGAPSQPTLTSGHATTPSAHRTSPAQPTAHNTTPTSHDTGHATVTEPVGAEEHH